MSDRKILADFLFNVLGNVITHHLLTVVTVLATWLTPRVRRAISWLQAGVPARRIDPWLRSVGSSKRTGGATLSDLLPPQDNAVMTPPTGSLSIVGMPPQLAPSTMPPTVAMAESREPHWFANNPWEGIARVHTNTRVRAALYTWDPTRES